MFFVSFLIFIFNIIFNYFIKFLLWNNVPLKLITLIILIIIAYLFYEWPYRKRRTLSGLRKIKHKFPKQYIIRDIPDFVKTVIVVAVYFSLFIVGLLYLRFLNTTKEINLYNSWLILQSIINNFSYSNLILNTTILLLILIIYLYIWKYLQIFFKLYKMKLYYASFIYESFFEKMFWKLHKLNVSNILRKITEYLFLICYYLGFIKARNTLNPFAVDPAILEVYPKAKNLKKKEHIYICRNTQFITPKWLELVSQIINLRTFKLHYYLLFSIFIFDVFFNNMILQATYKIMPYIFIYEIWVKYSKFFIFKNRSYDTFIFYFLYHDIIEEDDYEIVLGNRCWSREYLKNVLKFYVYNDFINKELFDHWEKINNSFSISEIYNYKFYYNAFIMFLNKSLKQNKAIILIFVLFLILYG